MPEPEPELSSESIQNLEKLRGESFGNDLMWKSRSLLKGNKLRSEASMYEGVHAVIGGAIRTADQ